MVGLLFFSRLLVLGVLRRRILAGCLFAVGRFFLLGRSRLGRCAVLRTGLGGIVGDVPAGTFELNGRGGEQTLDFASAVRALFQGRAGGVFDFLRLSAALRAF